MQRAAKEWDFERAALLRDEIMELKSKGAPKDEPSERQKEAIEHVEQKVGPRTGAKIRLDADDAKAALEARKKPKPPRRGKEPIL